MTLTVNTSKLSITQSMLLHQHIKAGTDRKLRSKIELLAGILDLCEDDNEAQTTIDAIVYLADTLYHNAVESDV